MVEAPAATPDLENFSFKIKDKNDKEYLVKVSLSSKNIIFNASCINSIKSAIYTKKITFEELQELKGCRYFRVCDNLEDAFDLLSTELELEKNTEIKLRDKSIILEIKIRARKNREEKLKLELEAEEIKTESIVDKLCDKMNEVDELKEKINELINYIGISEGILKNIIKQRKDMIEKYSGLKDSTIFLSIFDVNIVNNGISSYLSKNIKNLKLLYKASVDGDEATKFHEKCDNHSNTVTIV